MTVVFELGVSRLRRVFSISVCIFVSLLCDSMASDKVVIVGGGLAGLTAAIEASSSGSHVTLIEKEKALGGNSAKATSGINGAETDFQNKLGIHDERTWFEKDTLNSGDGLSDQNLVTTLTSNSKSAIEFLHSFDLQLSDVIKLGGHSASRTHRFSPTKEGRPVPVGFTLISTLKKHIEANLANSITVLTQSKFTGLLHHGETVVGVKYLSVDGSERELLGSVILTAGGFAHDKSQDSLLTKYAPRVYQLPTTNGPWATGDIIKATAKDHLALVHMDKIQIHPTGFLDPKDPQASVKMLAPEALRGCGGLLLNGYGRRFVDELTRRDYVTTAMFQNCNNFERNSSNPIYAVMLLNEAAIQKFGLGAANFYKFRGLLQDVGELKNVAQLLNVDKSGLEQMILDYKKSSVTGKDDFGKTTFPVIFEPEDHYFMAYVTPVVHYCMGGLKIDERARVLKNIGGASDSPVPGLFAAGEVTGGVHGQNRLGGNSLLECVVFGRIAGREASQFKQDPQPESQHRSGGGIDRKHPLWFNVIFCFTIVSVPVLIVFIRKHCLQKTFIRNNISIKTS